MSREASSGKLVFAFARTPIYIIKKRPGTPPHNLPGTTLTFREPPSSSSILEFEKGRSVNPTKHNTHLGSPDEHFATAGAPRTPQIISK